VKLKLKYTSLILFIVLFVRVTPGQDKNELPRIDLSLKNDYLNYPGLHLSNSPAGVPLLPVDSVQSKKKQNLKTKKEYKIIPWRLALLGTLGAGVFTAMHIYYKDTWWKDQRRFFKFAEDGYYPRNVDKVSHIYTANVFTEATAIAYEWSGISPDKSLLYGAITAMAYETYIEINDGFAPIWGFDWEDMGANFFGVLYPFFQREFPILNNFTFKWSFKPGWIKRKVSNSSDLLDDYTNMTFWLGVSPEGLLPKKAAKYYPGFLGFAVGLSIKNASHALGGTTNAYREWFISLDYDITKLPGKTDFLKKLKKILNFYHFPAPAVRVSPSGIWYGLYF
jgi:Predicted periplasmic lipoprotein (DUF2279)